MKGKKTERWKATEKYQNRLIKWHEIATDQLINNQSRGLTIAKIQGQVKKKKSNRKSKNGAIKKHILKNFHLSSAFFNIFFSMLHPLM